MFTFSSGPGQYNLIMKSYPRLALITSREDRFKVSVNTNLGPGAYQVNRQIKILLKYSYLPTLYMTPTTAIFKEYDVIMMLYDVTS